MHTKWMAIIACLAMLCSLFCGCGAENITPTDSEIAQQETADPVEQAKTAIQAGNYQEAYDLLKTATTDEAKTLLAKFAFVPVSMKKSDETVHVQYNSNGICVKVTTVDSEGEAVTNYETFDENGNCLTATSTGATGSRFSYEYTYDANNNLVKKIMHYEHDGMYQKNDTFVYEYTYDADSRLLSELSTNPDGSSAGRTEYTYDANGRCTKQRSHLISSYSDSDYTYDANGNCIKEVITFSDHDSQTVKNFSYDADGNCIREEIRYAIGTSKTVLYTYDSNGNMITRDDGKSVAACEWKLRYYENGVPKRIDELVREFSHRDSFRFR